MFAHRPDTQANVGAEEQELCTKQNQQGDIKDDVLLKEDIAQERDIREWPQGEYRKAWGGWQGWDPLTCRCENVQQVPCQAERDAINSDTAHNLVCLKIDGDNSMDESHQSTRQDRT